MTFYGEHRIILHPCPQCPISGPEAIESLRKQFPNLGQIKLVTRRTSHGSFHSHPHDNDMVSSFLDVKTRVFHNTRHIYPSTSVRYPTAFAVAPHLPARWHSEGFRAVYHLVVRPDFDYPETSLPVNDLAVACSCVATDIHITSMHLSSGDFEDLDTMWRLLEDALKITRRIRYAALLPAHRTRRAIVARI